MPKNSPVFIRITLLVFWVIVSIQTDTGTRQWSPVSVDCQ